MLAWNWAYTKGQEKGRRSRHLKQDYQRNKGTCNDAK